MTFLLVLVISVASYFFIKNANQQIVIDDQYLNPTFVHRSEIITVVAADERPNWSILNDGSYGKYESFSRNYLFSEVGMKEKDANISFAGIRRVDSEAGSYAWLDTMLIYDSNYDVIGFRYRIRSMELGAQYQVASFASLKNRIPSKEGLIIYNEKGETVFDAALGYLQVMDSQYHIRDIYSSKVQNFLVFNSDLPDLDFSKMFLITRQRPFAKTGGTIIINYRQYVTRLRKATNGVYVDLGMWGKTGGSRLQQYQSAFSFMVAYVHF